MDSIIELQKRWDKIKEMHSEFSKVADQVAIAINKLPVNKRKQSFQVHMSVLFARVNLPLETRTGLMFMTMLGDLMAAFKHSDKECNEYKAGKLNVPDYLG